MYVLLECFVVWFDLWLKSRQTIKEIWNCVGPLEWTSVLAEVATCFIFYANDCQLQANLNAGHIHCVNLTSFLDFEVSVVGTCGNFWGLIFIGGNLKRVFVIVF